MPSEKVFGSASHRLAKRYGPSILYWFCGALLEVTRLFGRVLGLDPGAEGAVDRPQPPGITPQAILAPPPPKGSG